jgi:hypothetical protein
MCRNLTQRNGPEAIRRMITACAAAGVAVVVVPEFARDGCHASSASKWLGTGTHRKAMIALSLRYRRDDQLYFSLFREAGALLAAWKMGSGTVGRNGPSGCCAPTVPDPNFHPDAFAREFLIPPEHDAELVAIGAIETSEAMSAAIVKLARTLGIAPGLVVGRLQHDGLIGWRRQNRLKREVDLSYVLEASEAAEETWPDQTTATRQVTNDLSLEAGAARERLRRAAESGILLTNGGARRRMRFEPGCLAAWRLCMRDRDLDADSEAA